MAQKPAARRPSTPDKAAIIRTAAFMALAKFGAKEADRELLKAGDAIAVNLNVCGNVNGRFFTDDVIGTLQVGADQTAASSSGPDHAHLVAVLLESMPRTKRRHFLDALPAGYLETKTLPTVAPETLSAAETLLDRLRDRQTVTRKGNVRFEPTPQTPRGA